MKYKDSKKVSNYLLNFERKTNKIPFEWRCTDKSVIFYTYENGKNTKHIVSLKQVLFDPADMLVEG